MTGNTLRIELAFHHNLGGDTGVIGAWLPQRIVAAHPVITGQRIHQSLVKTVAHVQRAGHIWRRQLNAKIIGFSGVKSGLEIARVFPFGIPA